MPLEIFRSWKLEKRLCKARRSRYRLYVAGSVASSDPCLALSRLWLLYSGLAGRSPTRTAADLDPCLALDWQISRPPGGLVSVR